MDLSLPLRGILGAACTGQLHDIVTGHLEPHRADLSRLVVVEHDLSA